MNSKVLPVPQAHPLVLMKESYWIFWVTWDDFNDFRLKLYFKSRGKQDFLNPKYIILMEKTITNKYIPPSFFITMKHSFRSKISVPPKKIRVFFRWKEIYQHRPQIAKTNFCVINIENSVTSERSSRQNSLLFSRLSGWNWWPWI